MEILMLPSTPKVLKFSKRELFARRMSMMDRPLVILNFQGVLGDFQKVGGSAINIKPGTIEGLRLLRNYFQLVVFSREQIEDSWTQSEGGQNVKFNEQNKLIKQTFKEIVDVKLDGLYSSLIPTKAQNMWDDYQQIYNDFGVNSEQKIKNRVLFVNCLANHDTLNCNEGQQSSSNDQTGYFLFDFSCQPPKPLM